MLEILLAAALAGAAYAAWNVIQQMRNTPSPGQNPGETPGDGAGREDPTERRRFQPGLGRENLLDEIVRSITFATTRMVVGQTILGTEERPSIVPTGDIAIRPMRGVSELPRTLTSTAALDDDVFFGQVAANQLPISEDIERVDLTEPEYGPSRNVLLVLEDISSSMGEHGRMPWAIRLNQRLAQKCAAENAEYILLPFNNYPEAPHRARTRQECRELAERMPEVLCATGGTDIDAVLTVGMDILEKEKFGEARILLVTDGTQGINADETRERLQTLGVKLHVVCIGKDHDQLRSIADKYNLLQDEEPHWEDE